MDFGLARDSGSSATRGLTESGAVMGTPAYMSPEQARGDTKRLGPRSDVYSLGATLYDILVGQPPFEDQSIVNILLKVMNESPLPLRSHSADIPAAVELIVGKCLNKEPEQRYGTAQALADDLGRYLNAQRITARRLGYSYRMSYWARRNPALAALAAGLLVSLLGLVGLGVRTRIAWLKKEEQAKREAALAHKLGQSVEALEWLVRTAYLLPLHDAGYEKSLVRARMAAITAELCEAGAAGTRLGAYALGRGHLALHEWEAAHAQLQRAAQLGYQDPELDYALGRVKGELYSRALEDARKSGDKSFFAQRKKELQAEYLDKALVHLQLSRHLTSTSPGYVEGLIDYYEQRYDAALLHAHLARRQAPWLYEAAKLEGDVFFSTALEQRDHGELDQAERSFGQAVNRYEQAAAIGHSDHQVHEALAETWLRWEEMDLQAGRDPEPKLRQSLAAADRALEAAPHDSSAYTKRAFARYFQAQFAQESGQADRAIEIFHEQIADARAAIRTHPDDAYAYEISGIGYQRLADLAASRRQPLQSYLDQAAAHFERSLLLNPRFPWAYNDYAGLLVVAATDRINRNQDPSEQIAKSIALAKQAVAIDPGYLFAYNTILVDYLVRTRWEVEHGRDPSALLPQIDSVAKSMLRINEKYGFVHGNLGEIYYLNAVHQADRQKDLLPMLRLSLRHLASMIEINGNIPLAHASVAFEYAFLARQLLAGRKDPGDAIESGAAALSKCYQLQPRFPQCQIAEAQLQAVRAELLRRQGKPYVSVLKAACALAQQASAQVPDSEELLLPQAQLSAQLAMALGPAGARSAAPVAQGLAASEHALQIAADWPRALAERGSLLLLRAQQTADAANRQESLRAASSSFERAFAGNPLLKFQFAEMAAAAAQPARP